MQVHNFPAVVGLIENDRSPVHESCPVIQMECSDGYISKHLDPHVFWLDIHVWGLFFVAANLIEDDLECLLELGAPIGALGERAGIEHRRIIGKRQAEGLPVEVVEGDDEVGKSFSNFLLLTSRLRLRQEWREDQHAQNR